MTPGDAPFEDAMDCLRRLAAILQREGEDNWVRGLRAAIAAGEAAERGETDRETAWKEMSSICQTMHRAPGGFGDWFVWRDDFNERKVANAELDHFRERLWRRLG